MSHYTNRLAGVETSINNIITQIEKGLFHASMDKRLSELESEKSIIESKISEIKNNREFGLPSEDEITKTLNQYQNIKK